MFLLKEFGIFWESTIFQDLIQRESLIIFHCHRSITRLSFCKWSLSSEFCCVLRFLKNYYHVRLQKALLLVIVSFDNLRLVIFPSVFQNKLWKSKPSWYYAIENFSFSKLNIFKSQNESLYEYRVILIVIAARL